MKIEMHLWEGVVYQGDPFPKEEKQLANRIKE